MTQKTVKAAIVGGAGYTGGELLRLLLLHPRAEVVQVVSRSHAGAPVTAVHRDLAGETGLQFGEKLAGQAEVVFICSGHGTAARFLTENSLPADTRVIDLSHDFRLKSNSHQFVYGLPELQKEAIAGARQVANPGCFATAIQLALLPLAAEGLLQDEVHVQAITGSTGAGQQPVATTHFSWRDSNVSVYKAFAHQHLAEIRQSLQQLQPGFGHDINFIPVRGNFARGIMATAYTRCPQSLANMQQLYDSFYQQAPLTRLVAQNPDLKQVTGTAKCLLHLQKHGDKLLVVSMIDNLLKGASGQAVQNMNLMFGLEEIAGLRLKATVF